MVFSVIVDRFRTSATQSPCDLPRTGQHVPPNRELLLTHVVNNEGKLSPAGAMDRESPSGTLGPINQKSERRNKVYGFLPFVYLKCCIFAVLENPVISECSSRANKRRLWLSLRVSEVWRSDHSHSHIISAYKIINFRGAIGFGKSCNEGFDFTRPTLSCSSIHLTL